MHDSRRFNLHIDDFNSWAKKEISVGSSFPLIVTSPPYNLSKEYEVKKSFNKYLSWQEEVVHNLVSLVSDSGSICYQVGNYVENGYIEPLDIHLHTFFTNAGFKLRNRIVWNFGHGLHCRRRFSGRYEVVLWYTKNEDYYFDLDAVRVPSKYPSKKSYKGKSKGEYSSNPKGKNPEDFWSGFDDCWNIPNVKGNHIEKTSHPCQFPVGLAERLVLALSAPGSTVLDPFCGTGSTGVASIINDRNFVGIDLSSDYIEIAQTRCALASRGEIAYRPHDRPIYDHTKSPLSVVPLRNIDRI